MFLKTCLTLIFISAGQFCMAAQNLSQLQTRLFKNYQYLLKHQGNGTQIANSLKSLSSIEVRTSMRAIDLFLKTYDQFNMLKIDQFMQITRGKLELEFERVNQTAPVPKQLKKYFFEALAAYSEYQNIKHYLGTPDDFKRVVAGRNFFIAAGKFSNSLKKMSGKSADRIWGEKALPFIDSPKEFLPLADDFIHLLYVSYFKSNHNGPNQAPIIDSLREISQNIAKEKKTKTAWFGLHHLKPMPLDGKSLNIFAFMHANSYLDTSVQGSLPLEGLSSIGNVDVIFPKFLAKRMKKSDHIVTVGDDSDAVIQKINHLVRSKKLNKFFVAPEGLTPIGLFEMRPLIDTFATSIYALIEKGIEVNIYPISFPDNFRFMNDYRDPIEGHRLAYGLIHPAITHHQIKDLLSKTNQPQHISHLIRWIWMNQLKNDARHELGMPKPEILASWLEQMYWEQE